MSFARRSATRGAFDSSTGANPAPTTDATHAPVGVDGAFNAPRESFSVCREDNDRVKILHGPTNKLRSERVPAESELFERSSFFGNLWGMFGTDASYKRIQGIDGTVAAPGMVQNLAVPGSIYIDGRPALADIHQGDLSDCYFLASVAAVVQSDPGQIMDAVTPEGDDGANVRLYRFDGTNAVPVNLSVTGDLRVADFGEGATGGSPLGAGMRAGPRPKYTDYWCEIDGTTLTIYADRYYETARWAPLLEKGYAQFAEQYGQYGGFRSEDKGEPGTAGAPSSGYDYLQGGVAYHSYELLYGPDVLNTGELDWTYTPGADNVTANLPVIENLLWAQGVGVPAGQEMHMTVAASREAMVERLDTLADALLSRSDIDSHADLKTDLTVLRRLINAWRTARDADKDTALEDVSNAAADIADRDEHPELYDAASPQEYRSFGENVNIVALIATDHSDGQRHTYAWHSYTVLGSTFRKSDGTELTLTHANLATQAPNIDPFQSTVRLRNPYGGNEPNLQGGDGRQDGEFTLTFDSFLRSFEFQQFGVVRT